MTTTHPAPASQPGLLRTFALVTALLTVGQAVLGLLIAFAGVDLYEVHGWLGYATFVSTVLAAVGAFLWMRQGGAKGLFFHALGLAVLALLQIGLAEMGLKWVHVVLGLLILGGALALISLAQRTSGTAPADRHV